MSDAPLSSRQAEFVLGTVAGLASAQLPLAEGLRAASSEATGRVARGLKSLSDELSHGETLEQALSNPSLRLPPHLQGMVAAAARTGQLGPALDQILEHQRSIRSMFWRIWASLAYPTVVFVMNLVILGFLLCWIVPVFKQMFIELSLNLPYFTLAVVEVSDMVVWLVKGPGQGAFAAFVITILALLYLAATGRGGAALQRLIIESMPIVGVLWQWASAASFMYLLGALLDKQVPLSEALRLAADGTPKADLRQSGRWMAEQVSKGRSFAELVESSGCLPASSVPLLRWGEQTNSLPEALRTLSAFFVERVQMRTDWLRSVSPPFVYLFVGLTAAAVIVSIFMPLYSMLQGLLM